MVTDGVTYAYHERGRLRPESVRVIEKFDECDVWMGGCGVKMWKPTMNGGGYARRV